MVYTYRVNILSLLQRLLPVAMEVAVFVAMAVGLVGGSVTVQANPTLAMPDGTVNLNLSPLLLCGALPREVSSATGSPANIRFHQLQRKTPNWQANNRRYLNQPLSKQSYWCKVDLENLGSNFRWVVSLNNTRLNYVSFYWVNQGEALPSQSATAGDSLPKTTAREVSAYPTFYFSLPKDGKGTLYFAVDTNSVGWMRPRLYSHDAFAAHTTQRQIWQWAYVVLIVVVLALRWFLAPLTSARIHFYLCLVVLCGAGYLFNFYGDTSLWLRGVSGEFKNTLLFAFNLGLQFFVLAFFTAFVETATLSPIQHRIYKCHSAFIVAIGVAVILVPQYNMLLVQLASLAALITAVLIVTATVLAFKQGQPWVWPLAISWSSIAVCGVILALVFLDLLPYNNFTGYALLWMFPLDVMMLVIALFKRHLQLQEEVVQLRRQVKTPIQCASVKVEKMNELPSTLKNASPNEKNAPVNSGDSIEKRLKGIDTASKVKEIKSTFEAERLYLDENIKLASVAARIQLRPDQISAIINRELGISFSSLVNEYRVQEGKKLMREKPHETLLNIAVSCGFNSRASFNRVFKVHENITPAEFRKTIATDQHNKDVSKHTADISVIY